MRIFRHILFEISVENRVFLLFEGSVLMRLQGLRPCASKACAPGRVTPSPLLRR